MHDFTKKSWKQPQVTGLTSVRDAEVKVPTFVEQNQSSPASGPQS